MSQRVLSSLHTPIDLATAIAHFPTIAQTGKHSSRAASYVHIPTLDLIEAITSKGLALHTISVAKVRRPDKHGFEKHLLRFRVPSFTYQADAPEVVIINSHDGSSAVQAFAGIIRFACANGLIAGTAFDKVRVYHTRLKAATVIDATYRVVDTFEALGKRVDTFKAIELTPDQQHDFACKALALRYPVAADASPFDAPMLDVSSVYAVRRPDDAPNTLWNTFNRVQETIMRGGIQGRRANGRRRNFTSRALTGIGATVDMNRKLFDLADTFAA